MTKTYVFVWRPAGEFVAYAMRMIEAENLEEAKEKFLKLEGVHKRLIYICELVGVWEP